MKEIDINNFTKPQRVLSEFVYEFCMEHNIPVTQVNTGIDSLSGTYTLRGKIKSYDTKEQLSILIRTKKWTLVFTEGSEKEIELFKIEIKDPYRRTGVGTELMNNILDVSDELNIGVKLIPYSFKTEDSEYMKNLEIPKEGINEDNMNEFDFPRMMKELKNNNKRRLQDTYFLKDWYRSFGFKSVNPTMSPFLKYQPQVEELKMVG
jgi:hypothetical protein